MVGEELHQHLAIQLGARPADHGLEILDRQVELGIQALVLEQVGIHLRRPVAAAAYRAPQVVPAEAHAATSPLPAGRRRWALRPSMVRRLISSYNTAGRGFGRSTRPSRCTYSRVAELPLTTIATFASGTSTPSFSTRPAASLL